MSHSAKANIRHTQREVLRQMSREFRREASLAASRILLGEPFWNASSSVLLFMPLPDELDLQECLSAALRAGKQVALPRYREETQTYGAALLIDPAQLRPGAYGIPEPPPEAPWIPLNQLDAMLVPGLAFDLSGTRLGRGKGFYDRLLAQTRGVKCGVAFDSQLLTNLPREANDIAMNYLLTPTRCVRTGL